MQLISTIYCITAAQLFSLVWSFSDCNHKSRISWITDGKIRGQ